MPLPDPQPVNGKRVTVVGLGRFGGGIGATRWLCRQGAKVTVSDSADAEQLADAIRAIDGCGATLHLGGHVENDFVAADLLVVSPAVPRDHSLVAAAERAGVARTTEINLFLQRCEAPIVGVTGSVGKSTTTAMVGSILAGSFTTHVGGNIGRSLLEELPAIRAEHVVVLELSSFQLEDLPLVGIGPRVAVVTNLAPNHLDRHGTMAAYADAKKNIFRFQSPQDVLVLNRADAEVASWVDEARGHVELFEPAPDQRHAFGLAVPGAHNQADAQAAWAAAKQFGVERPAAADALRGFKGLPHRLQLVADRNGVRYYNDSKCTTPAGAVVALEAFETRRTIIIAGGYDKHVSFEQLGAVIAARAKALVATGATREQIVAAVPPAADGPTIERADDLPAAVRQAKRLAGPGDVVLLSPACASFDAFVNYEQRGDLFTRIVREEL